MVARSGRDCDRRLVPGRPGGLVQIPRVPECEITCGGVRTASRAVAGTAGGCTERYSPGHRGIPFLQHLRSIVSVRCSLFQVTGECLRQGGTFSQRHLYAASDTQSVLGLTSLGLGHVGHQYFGHLPSSLTPPPHSLASWSNLSRSLRSPGMCNKILQIPENSELTRPRLLPC